jgi:transcriptional regulator with XRE-family HTH domain
VTGLDMKIEAIRQKKSQYEIARAAGVEPTRLNRILNGWIEPRDQEVSAIRAVLNL